MDGTAHEIAQGGIDHAMPLQGTQSRKRRANDPCFKVHAVVASHVDVRIGQAGLNEAFDLFSFHEVCSQGVGDMYGYNTSSPADRQLGPSEFDLFMNALPTAAFRPVTPLHTDAASLNRSGRRVMAIEIAALQVLADRINGGFHRACEIMLACEGRIVVTGMGKSGHIARKIAATLASTGTPSFFVHPGEASHGDLGMITDTDVVLILSYSGETDEVLTILPVLKRQGNRLIAITGNEGSSLARLCDVHLDISVPEEACPLGLAPTSSTTATLVMGDALAVALLEARGFTAEDFARSHPAGSLGRRLLLRISDIMHTDAAVPKVGPNASLADALVEMTRRGLGMTGIVDDSGRLLGVFTDGDLRRTLDDTKIDLRQTPVRALMTTRAKTIAPNRLAVEAAKLMEEHKIHALLVVGDDGALVGALNIHDLLRARVV